jgi:hypothetical protein
MIVAPSVTSGVVVVVGGDVVVVVGSTVVVVSGTVVVVVGASVVVVGTTVAGVEIVDDGTGGDCSVAGSRVLVHPTTTSAAITRNPAGLAVGRDPLRRLVMADVGEFCRVGKAPRLPTQTIRNKSGRLVSR